MRARELYERGICTGRDDIYGRPAGPLDKILKPLGADRLNILRQFICGRVGAIVVKPVRFIDGAILPIKAYPWGRSVRGGIHVVDAGPGLPNPGE